MSHVRYEQDGPIVLITIDRPERMNAIGPRTHTELVKAWRRFRDDDGALVGVLTGAGDRAFSAGGDLKASFVEGEPTVSLDPEERAAHTRGERGPSWARHAGRTCTSRRSPRSTGSRTRAGSSGCAGRTSASPTPMRPSG